MPFVIADRVRESSATTGTGNITLAGAVLGYQTFDAVLATGDTTFYTIADQSGPNWEVGIGTFTAPSTLARTTILESSNGGSVVNFSAGTKDVFISLPASKTNVEDQPNLIEVNSSSAALRITQAGSGNALLVEDSANPDATPFVVDASGSVGIGTPTPSGKLEVRGELFVTSALAKGLRVVEAGGVTYLQSGNGSGGTQPLSISPYASGTPYIYVDASGNVGIGTSSPTEKFEVSGNIKATAYAGVDGGTF